MSSLKAISQILAASGITRADGRPLHAYDLSDDLLSEIHEILLRCPRQQMRVPQIAGIYVIWAAERIRRNYDGTGLSWDFINAPLPHIFNGQRIENFIRRGLDFWARPIRYGRSGNRLFMYTLLAEGGIPTAVLEGARQHAVVLRQMIEDIGNRGGVTLLGFDLACDLARMRMRYLPRVLQHDDTIALFVELAQAIFELRQVIPQGMPTAQVETWLNNERPNWQRELPIRLTPQVIDNIIRPSLTAARKEVRSGSHPAHREIHADIEGCLNPVVVLAQQATLPPASLPATDTQVLRLLPRFPTRRPLAYRALRSADDPSWQLERLGGSGPEIVSHSLFEALEFDVMADGHNLGVWVAMPSLPSPEEAPTFWAGTGSKDQPLRLRNIVGGCTRNNTIWITLPAGATAVPDDTLAITARHTLNGAELTELRGHGALQIGQHRLRISTGAEADADAAELFVFGKTLPEWRLPSGDAVYLGTPQFYGQRGETPMTPLAAKQIRRSLRNSPTYGAEFHEWNAEGETLALVRLICLPAGLAMVMQEQADGGLRLQISGLPTGLMLDLRAGTDADQLKTGTAPALLSLPPRAPDTAFVRLSLTEIASGKQLDLLTPWPARLPQFLYKGALLPVRDLALAFDDLDDLIALAPGNRSKLTVSLPSGRSFELPLSGTVPMLRHATLLRRMLLQGSADNAIILSMHNNAGQTGRVILRRYYGTIALAGDELKLGLPVDAPRAEFSAIIQSPGRASLHLMNIDTGEAMELAADMASEAINLREISGVESGLWLVQGRFAGRQQRPAAWHATPPEDNAPPHPSRRSDRIAAYRNGFRQSAIKGGDNRQWQDLLQKLLATRDGGDPAMLDQFHALAGAPESIARMLLTLPEADLAQFFSLDGYWNLFWPGLPVKPIVAVAKDILETTSNMMLMAGSTPSEASQIATAIIITRLAFLRVQRPELGGQIAIVLLEIGEQLLLFKDSRFEGLMIANPKLAMEGADGAIQAIAKSDPNLPRGVRTQPPVVLSAPRDSFQKTVEMMVCAVLSVAEQAMGLRPSLDPEALLDVMLVEITSPELFARALQPAMWIAYEKSQSLK